MKCVADVRRGTIRDCRVRDARADVGDLQCARMFYLARSESLLCVLETTEVHVHVQHEFGMIAPGSPIADVGRMIEPDREQSVYRIS